MTLRKAIKAHCLDCAGEVASDVVFCVIKDCPLWPFRLGCSARVHNARIEKAWERNSDAANEARGLGLDMPFFKISISKTRQFHGKRGPAHTKGRVSKKEGQNG